MTSCLFAIVTGRGISRDGRAGHVLCGSSRPHGNDGGRVMALIEVVKGVSLGRNTT